MSYMTRSYPTPMTNSALITIRKPRLATNGAANSDITHNVTTVR